MLNGSNDYDEVFDEPTKELLEEITRVSEIIPRDMLILTLGELVGNGAGAKPKGEKFIFGFRKTFQPLQSWSQFSIDISSACTQDVSCSQQRDLP